MQREKAEFRAQREQFKAEVAKVQSMREEVEYKRQQMERGYVNLKREKSLMADQVGVIEEIQAKLAGYLKDYK
jgi:CDP-glycerol glycerophosphotransferase (TagB/SpsB family)